MLEEPPANTYLILVCHRLHGLPATIRSRCQLLRPALPSAEQSLEWLDRVCGERKHSEQLLELAGGRPLLAAQLYSEASAERLQLVRQATGGLFNGQVGVTGLTEPLQVRTWVGRWPTLWRVYRRCCAISAGPDLASAQARGGFPAAG